MNNANPKHPIQPLVEEGGTVRFKVNKIVERLLSYVPGGLNTLRRAYFPDEDWQQFFQLTGISLDDYKNAPHVNEEACERALNETAEKPVARAVETPHIRVSKGVDNWTITTVNGLPAIVECVTWDGKRSVVETYDLSTQTPHFVSLYQLGYGWTCPLCDFSNVEENSAALATTVTCKRCQQPFNSTVTD